MTYATGLEEERHARRRGWVIAVAALVLIGALILVTKGRGLFGDSGAAAGAGGMDPGSMPPMPVDVAVAARQNVIEAVRATGRIEALQAVDLRPDEEGRITELLFREGQRVDAGTPLVRIDDAMLKAQAERATADRDLSQQQLERMRRLRADNAASPADMERAEAAAKGAEASLALLRLQVERTTVRAPFAGVVGQRFVSAGDYVTTSTRLLTLQTMDPQRAVIHVPERHAANLRVGQSVEFTVAAYPKRAFRAQVDFIDPVVQDADRTIVVKARAPNPDYQLKPGMFVEARLATATRPNAVVVPEDAVQPLRTANVVWAVVDGKASRRIVQLGERAQGVVEIVSGVKAGEQVVVGGLDKIGEGSPVAPRPSVSSDSAAAAAPAGGASPAPTDSQPPR